ncbi:MAG: tRNA pseudouridine(38-40) synthase TruA [Actinobacteria bacterium]|nr:tRNA pseudouridine(38-40) synthase TruA [Actinomycetota bacterium]
MNNYMAVVEYDGSGFCGFQVQPGNMRTVQGELLRVLEKVLSGKVKICYAGRTDAGVHATNQVISFKTGKELDLYRFKWSANSMLPDDIVLKEIKKTGPGFDARRSARQREYCYYVVNDSYQSVFLKKYSILITGTLRMDLMKEAAGYFTGVHDFSSFCSPSVVKRNTIRQIYDLSIEKGDRNLIIFRICANSFLYNMVRIMMGAILEAGRGERDPVSIKEALLSGEKGLGRKMVPAKGLFLNRVVY